MNPVPPVSPIPVSPINDPTGEDDSFGDPIATEGAAWEAVTKARTRTLDAGEGFKKMVEHAEPHFAPIADAFLELHACHGTELTRILTDAGFPPKDDGSAMGLANRLVVAARAVLDDIDGDVMQQIHSGEEHVVAAYEEALAADLPGTVRDRIAGMLAELNELLDDTRPIERSATREPYMRTLR